MPIWAVVGIDQAGQRDVLAFCVGERENQQAWEDLLADLKRRGVKQVDLWITDGNQAMVNAIANTFPASQRPRCLNHKIAKVLAYVPEKPHERIRPDVSAICYQDSRAKAALALAACIAKYESISPSAIQCLRRDLAAGLTFSSFPKHHWKYLRTTNIIERFCGEVKRRSRKMAAAFRNEQSCLFIFYAVTRSLKLRSITVPAQETEAKLLHNS